MRQTRLTAEQIMQARIERDRRMILTPAEWPRWPTLPLKRRDGCAHKADFCGFVLNRDHSMGQVTMYLHTVYGLDDVVAGIRSKSGRPMVTWDELAACLEKRVFDNLDALLAEYTVD